jgi:hypothetical protein
MSSMTTALTMVYHDPAGRMRDQIDSAASTPPSMRAVVRWPRLLKLR